MKEFLKRPLALAALAAAITGSAAFAGALILQVGNPEANTEAKSLNAILVVRATACHEPAKSTVSANFVQLVNGEVQRTPLKVIAMKEAGTFAVIGSVPPGSAVDVALSNPEYKNYQPRVLIRTDANGIQWASMKHFFSVPPTEADVKLAVAAID